jgi:hypothetical protein
MNLAHSSGAILNSQSVCKVHIFIHIYMKCSTVQQDSRIKASILGGKIRGHCNKNVDISKEKFEVCKSVHHHTFQINQPTMQQFHKFIT